eukprot:COSAG04_NODE_5751_length_1503_cov_1.371083_2_plen_64_part_00
MAPAVGLGHAATALSLLALGLNVETRFRAGGLLTAQLSEPEPELCELFCLAKIASQICKYLGS